LTEFSEVSAYVNMLTFVNSQAPIYTFEFQQLVDAIRKFRDFFDTVKTKYGIPQSKIDELDSYLALLPSPEKPLKYMDVIRAKDQNNLVEALRVVGELVPYIEVLLYQGVYYISPTVKTYYVSYYSGYKDNWYYGDTISYFAPHIWCHKTLDHIGAPRTMSCFEVWFNVDKRYEKAKVHITAKIYKAKPNEKAISVYFLSSGEPLPRSTTFIEGGLSIKDRTDVSKVAEVGITYQSGIRNYDEVMYADVYTHCPYIVVAMHDYWLDTTVDMQISRLAISSAT